MAELTIAFVDLTGSVALFEALGDERATRVVTHLTHWIGSMGRKHQGQVVKVLGDGVLLSFSSNRMGVDCMCRIQREHSLRVSRWPDRLKLMLQIGIARGPVVEVDGDCFGDAVNVASRLSDLAGPEQILSNETVVRLQGDKGVERSRSLGPILIKGRAEPTEVFRIEWQTEMKTDFLTLPGDLQTLRKTTESVFGGIELSWLDLRQSFQLKDLPLMIGRVPEAGFVVNDPRVSRLHASIDFRSGNCVLEDTSSYGTWVRFLGGDNAIALRRQECVLHSEGEFSMGVPFTDISAPVVSFRLVDDSVVLRHGHLRS